MRTTITVPDVLYEKVKQKVEKDGYVTINEYLLSLIRPDVKEIPVISPGIQLIPPQMVSPVPSFIDRPMMPPIPPSQPMPSPIVPPVPIPPAPRPKIPTPVRDPNTPDPYLTYGGKCQFKNVSPDNIICLQSAERKLGVAQNQTGEMPGGDQFLDVYLCPDHTSLVSHSSGFFVK